MIRRDDFSRDTLEMMTLCVFNDCMYVTLLFQVKPLDVTFFFSTVI